LDAHYLGYFECFNGQLFFEAHEVLEELWLQDRRGPNGDFYKGLIQLAGAFVHVQKSRPGPAAALFRLAEANLGKYGSLHQHLDIERVLRLITDWLNRVQGVMPAHFTVAEGTAPKLALLDSANPFLRSRPQP
jgi:predicted metal-dependent hydrolase